MELTLSLSAMMAIAGIVVLALSGLIFFLGILVNFEIAKITDNPTLTIFWKTLVTAMIFTSASLLIFIGSMHTYLSSGTLQ